MKVGLNGQKKQQMMDRRKRSNYISEEKRGDRKSTRSTKSTKQRNKEDEVMGLRSTRQQARKAEMKKCDNFTNPANAFSSDEDCKSSVSDSNDGSDWTPPLEVNQN